MTLKTLELSLGVLVSPAYAPGWYWDSNTQQAVYFDASTRKFYTLQSGIFVPLANWNPAPKQVTLAPGDKLHVTLGFQYIGPAVTGVNAHYSINKSALFGGEVVTGDTSFNIPANLTANPVGVTNSFTFTIPVAVETNWIDIYVKLSGGTPAINAQEFGYSNALVIVAASPSITGFAIKDFAKV